MTVMGSCASANFPNRILAQSNIVPDATLGTESSFVVPNFNGLSVEAIGGGAVRGQNLFHSFREFNVSEGRGAYFFSPNAAIQNILARVTGNNPSQILGTLGTFGSSQPNLFLINPNGIIFGRNARLNVGSSFFASTANSVVFDNGFEFGATNPQAPPLLTINVPIGLQYSANPGRIVNQSLFGLRVRPGRTLALVGGEVALQGGSLFAPDGRIELGSVAGNDQVGLTPTDTGYALNYEGIRNFQDIRLTQAAFVFTDGAAGGSIQVQGRNVTLTNGSQISASPLGAGKGGGLSVNASESVQVIGRSADGRFPSGLFTEALRNATGEAGELKITTSQLSIRDGAVVSANNFGSGEGGNLTVNASESVQVSGISTNGRFSSGLLAQAQGTGDAGDLMIVTGQLLISEGAQVSASTFGSGKGGNLTVNASESLQVIGTSADGEFFSNLAAQANQNSTGDAGDLSIITNRLLVSGGAQVSTGTFGAGKGGNLTVNASDSVEALGSSADGQFFSTLSAQANEGTGDGGDLSITTNRLLISEGAQVGTGTLGAGRGGDLSVNASDSVQVLGTSADGRSFSYLGTGTYRNATGDAGDLSITTNRLLISEGAQVDAGTFGAGKGGNLTINASDSVQVNGTSTDGRVGSTLSTQAAPNATGTAGDLSITTNRLLISEGARVSTGTFGAGKGGNLTINASGSVQVLGTSADGKFGSKVTTQAQGTGDAGDLSIITDRLLIRDGAQVDAATFGAGKGGNLTVDASQDMQVIGTSADGEFGSTLSAQASPNATGDAGDVTITTARLLIKDGAQVRTLTSGAGKGGDLTVNASEEVQLIGTTANGRFASGLFVSADAGSTAGDLIVKTRQMSVRDGAAANVSSTRGQAGNMTISADSLLLNRGRLFAVTGKSTVEGGANITLQGLDLLRMDNESFISASALENANGGNVTIDSTFIVATPPTGSKGSDITANAVRGNGGNVNVTTQGLFGIEFRPKLTPDNDITASSEFGVAGIVNINTPGVDPSRGLSELPSDVVDATQQIDRRCTPAAADKRSSFVITGRGGLPPSPSDTLQGESVITHWVTLDSEESTNHTAPQPYPTRTAPKQLVEAQSWIYGANGEVILIAQAPTATPQSSWQIPPSCDAVGREEKKVFNAEGR